MKDTIKFEVAQAERLKASDIGRALARQARMHEQSRQFFERYDYFVLPVTQVAPFDVTTAIPDVDQRDGDDELHRLDAVLLVHHLHGESGDVGAGRVHLGRAAGRHSIVGRHRDDWSVLQLAYAFEQATQHGRRRPSAV